MDLYLDDWIFFGLVWDLWYANSLANSKPTGVAGIRLGTQNPWLGTAMPWRWMKMHGFAAVLHHIDNIFQINRCVLFDVVLQDLRGPVYYCMIIRTDFVIYHCAFCLNVARIFTWISLNVFRAPPSAASNFESYTHGILHDTMDSWKVAFAGLSLLTC